MRAPYVLLSVPALLPLTWLVSLDWMEYCRVGVIAAGWAFVLWRDKGIRGSRLAGVSTSAMVLALALIFIVNQFDWLELGIEIVPKAWAPTWVPMVAIATAFVVCSWSSGFRRSWNGLDWLAIALGMAAMSSTAGRALVTEQVLAWPTLTKIMASVMLWLTVTRAGRKRPGTGRALSAVVVAALAIVAFSGCVRIGSVYYHTVRGQAAQRGGALSVAEDHYRKAHDLSSSLGLDTVRKGIAYKLAGILAAAGMSEDAAGVLSLDQGYVMRIPARRWDGPEGGRLFYNVSCWKDVDLLPGEVEIRIYAQGDPALGEWPQMRVTLGGRDLGYVFVDTEKPAPYAFVTDVEERGTQRLEVSFLNDYFEQVPHGDRNLWIDRAEIVFRKTRWE